MKRKEIQHLFWRVGFGMSPKQLDVLSQKNKAEIIDELFLDSAPITPLKIDTSEIEHLTFQMMQKSSKKKRELIIKNRKKVKEFNVAWVNRLTDPKELLRERMTLFWANHFACRDLNIRDAQNYNNTLRTHALGDFKDFVKAISKEAAMLKYLNNKQNRKRKPNENFARELMELFTLGIGNYTEKDIKESARAFTGYNHNREGEFRLISQQHDYDYKSFFGHRGRYDGDDIIDIILKQKQCAQFICEKIYGYFVNDKININDVDEMVAVFYPNYNIEELMRFVFSSEWFYDEKNQGSKIKSPIEFLIGMHKVVPFEFVKQDNLFVYQKILGQVLLYPPNVAGWKGGKSWIDSTTIMLRLRLPSLMFNNAKISTKEKSEFNDSFRALHKKTSSGYHFFKTQTDWDVFNDAYENVSYKAMQTHLLLCETNDGTANYLERLNKLSKRDFCVQLMSLPEYQMC